MAADTKVQMAFEYRSKKSYNPKFTAPPPTSVQTSEISAAERLRQKAKEEKAKQEQLARERKNGKAQYTDKTNLSSYLRSGSLFPVKNFLPVRCWGVKSWLRIFAKSAKTGEITRPYWLS